MAHVTITLPSILASLIEVRTIKVEATSVREALNCLTDRFPILHAALFDETEELREHVLCFHNSASTRWYAQGLQHKLQSGDELTILQAVSGG